jgi:hypothetical protein
MPAKTFAGVRSGVGVGVWSQGTSLTLAVTSRTYRTYRFYRAEAPET